MASSNFPNNVDNSAPLAPDVTLSTLKWTIRKSRQPSTENTAKAAAAQPQRQPFREPAPPQPETKPVRIKVRQPSINSNAADANTSASQAPEPKPKTRPFQFNAAQPAPTPRKSRISIKFGSKKNAPEPESEDENPGSPLDTVADAALAAELEKAGAEEGPVPNKTWNLRPRKPLPNANGSTSVMRTGAPLQQALEAEVQTRDRRNKGKSSSTPAALPTLRRQLSQQQINEDFIQMTGKPAPRKPLHRRPRAVQKVLDVGIWIRGFIWTGSPPRITESEGLGTWDGVGDFGSRQMKICAAQKMEQTALLDMLAQLLTVFLGLLPLRTDLGYKIEALTRKTMCSGTRCL